MKRTISFIVAFMLLAHLLNAQGLPTGKRTHKPIITNPAMSKSKISKPAPDSTSTTPVQKQTSTTQSPRTIVQPKVNKEKLDDLRNPFDTNKVKKPATRKMEEESSERRKHKP